MRSKIKHRLLTLGLLLLATLLVVRRTGFSSQTYHVQAVIDRSNSQSEVSFGTTAMSRAKRHILSTLTNVTQEGLRYAINVHYWDYNCGHSVESLRSHPLFPYLPFRRGTTNKLEFTKLGLRFGARIFGFLHPDVTGIYVFALSSDDASEFWLSTSNDPLQSVLLAEVGGSDGQNWTYYNQFDKYDSQKSRGIFLKAGGKYFFEILWKQNIGRGHLQLVWRLPGQRKYEIIGSKYLSKYYSDDFLDDGLVYEDHLKTDLSLEDLPAHVDELTRRRNMLRRERKTPYQRDSPEFLSLPILEFKKISKVLPTCEYKPTYLISPKEAEKIKLYEGIHLPHYFNSSTRVWPHDETWSHSKDCYGGPGDHLKPLHCVGNPKLDKNTANQIMFKFMNQLKKFSSNYKLHTVVNMEQGNDDKNGNRYLLEAAVENTKEKKVYRLSVYVYKKKGSNQLCYPENFQWNPSTMVYLTLTVKNQGPWVYQYIMSLARIHRLTKDSRFSLLIIDFDSYDINIENVLRLSGLPHYQVINMRGKFHKTIAIQEAASKVKDPNSIILQTDLHLEFPLHFIDDTRKHCVQGKMGYTPLLLRLACGRFPHKPAGFWEFLGYGVFGLYKSDWDIVGGMNVEKFRNAWGGEDWEFGDRVIKYGYEIERLRLPYFFHYFHTKKGMWDGKAS